jgi:MYND finger
MATSSTTATTEAPAATNLTTLNARPTSIQWIETLELGYANDSDTTPGSSSSSSSTPGAPAAASSESSSGVATSEDDDTICFYCQTAHTKLFRCSKCQVAAYCQKDCQVNDWKIGHHKYACESYKRLGRNETFSSPDDQALARQDIFARIRLYACAYAVFKTRNLGRGFLFLQSQHSLAQMSYTIPKNCHGHVFASSSQQQQQQQQQPRAILLHYLTLGEFDAELCRDDFEMAMLRSQLQKTVLHDYDDQMQVVLLWRFRCGHVALGIAPLTPDHAIALKLGIDYFGKTDPPSLQLNIDDV